MQKKREMFFTNVDRWVKEFGHQDPITFVTELTKYLMEKYYNHTQGSELKRFIFYKYKPNGVGNIHVVIEMKDVENKFQIDDNVDFTKQHLIVVYRGTSKSTGNFIIKNNICEFKLEIRKNIEKSIQGKTVYTILICQIINITRKKKDIYDVIQLPLALKPNETVRFNEYIDTSAKSTRETLNKDRIYKFSSESIIQVKPPEGTGGIVGFFKNLIRYN